jgi:hypothetical protein
MGAFSPAFSPAFTPSGGLAQLVWSSPPHTRTGPYVSVLDGAHRLWRFRGKSPQWPSSLLLFAPEHPGEVGTVVEVSTPTQEQANAADVFILGGVDYRVEHGSWEYAALTAAGWPFREVGPREGV